MKKALALIICAVMLMTVAIASTSAAPFDIRNALVDYGQPNYLVGTDYVAVPPMLDGNVGNNEYTFSNTIARNDTAFVDNALEGDLKEYVAHDAEWIYWAVVVTEGNIADSEYGNDGNGVARAFQFQFNADDSGDVNTSYNRILLQFGLKKDGSTNIFEIAKRHPTAGTNSFDRSFFVDGTYDAKAFRDDTAGTTTYELKIKKEALKNACEASSIEHISVMYYIPKTATQVLWFHSNRGGSNAGTACAQVSSILRDNTNFNINWLMRYFYFTEALPVAAATETEPTLDPNLFTTAAPAATTPKVTTAITTVAGDVTTAAAETTAAENKGCGSSIALTALVMIPAAATGVAVACTKKRKNDD